MITFDHTRIRVGDLDRSIQFYCDHFDFEVKSRSDKSPAGNHIAHLALPGNEHKLELTWSEDYNLKVPGDLLHFCIRVPNIVEFCDKLEKNGLEIWPEDWREKFSDDGMKMAFVDDPDGYEMEILEQ